VEFFENWSETVPKINVDDVEFNTEDLCDEGRADLAQLQVIELQIAKLKNEISIYKTARNAYATELKKHMTALTT
jgi:hypothetical protein